MEGGRLLSGTLCRVIALLGTDRCLVCGINSVYGGAALIVCGNGLELSFHRDVFTLYRCDRHFFHAEAVQAQSSHNPTGRADHWMPAGSVLWPILSCRPRAGRA